MVCTSRLRRLVHGKIVLSITVLVTLCPTFAWNQRVDAVIKGKVSDESGGALPGATVVVTNRGIGVDRSTVTDEKGHYVLHSLPASTYDVRAELTGFAPHVRQAQTLYVGTTVDIDFVLGVAGIAESVTVRGALPLLETSQHTLARLVQTDEIDTLPVIHRNLNDLAALAPGVTKTGASGGVDICEGRCRREPEPADPSAVQRTTTAHHRIVDWWDQYTGAWTIPRRPRERFRRQLDVGGFADDGERSPRRLEHLVSAERVQFRERESAWHVVRARVSGCAVRLSRELRDDRGGSVAARSQSVVDTTTCRPACS
jgi:carboxypeptidase family protein